LGIVFVALLLLGLAGEVLLRAAPGLSPAAQGASEISQQIEAQSALALSTMVYAPDPELGALLAPSLRNAVETLDYTYTLQTDHAGFPNPEPWPSQVDVAVLGDSLLIGPGVGVEGQFTTVLQHRLDGRTVLNLGIPGGGTGHDYLAYRRYLEPLRPRLVVAVVCVAWDIDNTFHFERWRTEAPDTDFTRYRMSFGDTHRTNWESLKRQIGKSYLVQAVHGTIKSLRKGPPIIEQVAFSNGDAMLLSGREQKSLARGLDRPGVPNWREVFFAPLERLRTEVEAQGGRFVVALLPSKEELYAAEALPAVLRTAQEVKAELEARRLPVLDLYPALRERGQETPPYYRTDIHLNELGNRIVADAIASWIADQKIFTAASTAANDPQGRAE
jgi:lysophospholipase L1-like esterase